MAPLDISAGITLPPLPFSENALEPTISARTIECHYGKHHQAYVDKTNELLKDSELAGRSLEDIIRLTAGKADQQKLFNNAAQAWNHTFYWNCLSPEATKPGVELQRAIEGTFGSLPDLKKKLCVAGMEQFGTGWAWLVLKNGKLEVMHTADADTPIAHGITPLLTLDVWEHAYYLDYQNQREAHLRAVLARLMNWPFVSANFAHAMD